MLAKSKIQWAINETLSMKGAARLLGCSYNTFKKYSKMYGIFQPLPSNAGIPKSSRVGVKPPELQAIFNAFSTDSIIIIINYDHKLRYSVVNPKGRKKQ